MLRVCSEKHIGATGAKQKYAIVMLESCIRAKQSHILLPQLHADKNISCTALGLLIGVDQPMLRHCNFGLICCRASGPQR